MGFSPRFSTHDARADALVTSRCRRATSANVEQLVRLQAEPPARMRETIRECNARIVSRDPFVAGIERLQEELLEVE